MTQFRQAAKEEQVYRSAERYQVRAEASRANTGTLYFSLTAPDGAECKVRVADHADAYCTATFTIDPADNQIKSLQAWLKKHGEKKAAAPRIRYRWLKEDGCFCIDDYTTKAAAFAADPGNATLMYRSKKTFGWKEA